MNQSKKKCGLLFTLILAALCLALPANVGADELSVLAGGPPDGKGRKPDNPGGTVKGDLLGDLWVVVRDVSSDGDGEPIYFTWTWSDACYAAGDFDSTLPECYPVSNKSDVAVGCVQPITETAIKDPDGEPFTYIEYVDSYGVTKSVNLIPLDPECNIPAGYEDTWGTQTIEVDSGRLALARTTDYVITDAYNEAIAVINSAFNVDLDAAGRLLLTLPIPDAELNTDGTTPTYLKTVDSPRENLALYQRLMQESCLPGITDTLSAELSHLVCDPDPNKNNYQDQDLLRAASFLAGAADKSGAVGIDEVIYLNSILEINTIKEVGDTLLVEGYFDFNNLIYDRSDTYNDEVKANLLQPGNVPTGEDYPTSFDVVADVLIYDKVFSGDWNGITYPIVNFVRASDDALNVIYYIHNYALPEYLLPPTAIAPTFNRNQEMNLAPSRSLAE